MPPNPATPGLFYLSGNMPLCLPVIPAGLADRHTLVFCLKLLSFWRKYLHDQGGEEKYEPFDRNPVPAPENPPNNAVMFVFDFRF